jgi:hypothetical protein
MAWLPRDPAAGELLGVATAVFVLGEVAATFAGGVRRAGGCCGAWRSPYARSTARLVPGLW